MKKIFLSLFVILSLNINAQYIVNYAQNVDQNLIDGLYYNLPRNVIRLDFEVEQTIEMKGKYANYTEDLLGIDKYIKDDNTKYNIKNVNISVLTESDNEMTFHISIDDKSKDNHNLYLDLTSEGCISSWGIKREKIILADNDSASTNEIDQYDASREFYYIPLKEDESEELDDKESLVSKTKLSEEETAQTIVDEIKKMRLAYLDLITGYQEIDYGNTMSIMLDELKKMEEKYLALFVGKTVKHNFVKTFYIIPEEGTNNYVIGKFSENDGFNSKSGDNVKMLLQIESSDVNKIDKNTVKNTTYNNKIVYRKPANVDMELIIGNEQILENRVQINQLGDFILLPINKMKLEFDVNNGRLISVMRE